MYELSIFAKAKIAYCIDFSISFRLFGASSLNFSRLIFSLIAFIRFSLSVSATFCFFINLSTRPSVSTNFTSPVQNGWHVLQISTDIESTVAQTVNLFPHAQVTIAFSLYVG